MVFWVLGFFRFFFFYYFLKVNICFLLFAGTSVSAVRPKSITRNKLNVSRVAQRLEPGRSRGMGTGPCGGAGGTARAIPHSEGYHPTARVITPQRVPQAGHPPTDRAGSLHGGDPCVFLLVGEFWGLTRWGADPPALPAWALPLAAGAWSLLQNPILPPPVSCAGEVHSARSIFIAFQVQKA